MGCAVRWINTLITVYFFALAVASFFVSRPVAVASRLAVLAVVSVRANAVTSAALR